MSRMLALSVFLYFLFPVSNSRAQSSPLDWNFTVPRQASRTAGVAPLVVHFSAGLTPSTPEAQPFHDYEYSWDFGDETDGTWGTSGKSKNSDKGPVAAHVYETSGTLTATLTVRDGSGVIDSETFTITVSDPDVVFSGTNTTCISTTSDFSGCPAGANQVTTSDLSVLSSYTDAGERVLLHRGSSWTVNSNIAFPRNAGPVHIGAYGSCLNPNELGICSNAPAVTMTGGNQFLSLSRKHDWRLTDISFSAASGSSFVAVSGAENVRNNSIIRIRTTGFGSQVVLSHHRRSDEWFNENIAVISCELRDCYNTPLYVGSEHLVLLGNKTQNSNISHATRIWQAYQGVIAHNIMSGADLDNGIRHALKLHGPEVSQVGPYSETGSGGLRYPTEFAVVANNVFGGSAPWPVSIGPQNAERDERVSDLIIEKNKMLADYGLQSSRQVQVGLMFEGRYITARNNIVDGTGGYSGYLGIFVARRGVEWTPLGNRVYHNTIYSQLPHVNRAYGIQIHPDASNTVVRNNYISFPNATGPAVAVQDNSGNAIATGNVITETPHFVDPNNSAPLARDFRLTPAATSAVGQGENVPVFDDLNGNARTVPCDLGAYEFTTNSIQLPPPRNLLIQ